MAMATGRPLLIKKRKMILSISDHPCAIRAAQLQKGQSIASPNLENERLIVDLSLLVCQNWGVSAKMLRSLVQNHSEEAIQQAVRVTENALAQGKVKEAAGFFVQAVRQGYSDSAKEPNKEENKKKAQQEALKKQELAQKELIAKQRQAEFEKEKTAVLALLAKDKLLRSEVITRLHGGILRGSYDDAKSFEENMKTPLLLGAVLNIVKSIKES